MLKSEILAVIFLDRFYLTPIQWNSDSSRSSLNNEENMASVWGSILTRTPLSDTLNFEGHGSSDDLECCVIGEKIEIIIWVYNVCFDHFLSDVSVSEKHPNQFSLNLTERWINVNLWTHSKLKVVMTSLSGVSILSGNWREIIKVKIQRNFKKESHFALFNNLFHCTTSPSLHISPVRSLTMESSDDRARCLRNRLNVYIL